MSKYTPGPWSIAEEGTCAVPNTGTKEGIFIKSRGRTDVALAEGAFPGWRGGALPTIAANRANARLIASAPDLLEACKNMLWHEDKYAARKQAIAAIARAEGAR
jgi:hypothetical protein